MRNDSGRCAANPVLTSQLFLKMSLEIPSNADDLGANNMGGNADHPPCAMLQGVRTTISISNLSRFLPFSSDLPLVMDPHSTA